MIKKIFNIVPKTHSGKLGLNIVLSTISQLFDFLSVLLLLPVLLGIFNPRALEGMTLHVPFFYLIDRFPIQSLAAVVIFYLIKNFLSIKIIRFQADYYFSISNSLSRQLLQNFLEKDLLEVKSRKNSAVMKDIIFIPNNFVNYVLAAINQLISDCFLMIMILFGCFFINPIATILLFLITTVLVTGMYYFEKRKLDILNKAVEGKYNNNFSHLVNSLNGFVEIRVNRLEQYFIEKFNISNSALNKIYSDLTTNRLAKPKYTETFLILIIVCLFLTSKYVVKDDGANVLLVAFLFAASIKVIPAINRMLISITNLKTNLYTIDILRDRTAELHKPDHEKKPFLDKIELKDISFNYPGSNPLLDNIQLTIKKGEIIGIFGNSGNGKSTLINILTTLIVPNHGQLLFDGTVLTKNNRDSFIDHIAYVPQAPFLLEGTIRENIFLGHSSYDHNAIGNLLRIFELEEAIDNLPEKLDCFVGSNGYSLSGGQLQRLAIVRALLRKPAILLLDEATNQMDESLRERILSIIKEISRNDNMTIIIISHNQSELESFSDRVFELKNAALYPVK